MSRGKRDGDSISGRLFPLCGCTSLGTLKLPLQLPDIPDAEAEFRSKFVHAGTLLLLDEIVEVHSKQLISVLMGMHALFSKSHQTTLPEKFFILSVCLESLLNIPLAAN